MVGQAAIFLIGMPGAGKTTLGCPLAAALGRPFMDTDLIIEQAQGCRLQSLVDREGTDFLKSLEEQLLLDHDFSNAVVSTGGSVVYSERGMERLGSLGLTVYLDITLDTMQTRIDNEHARGLVRAPGTSLASLYQERARRYEKFSNMRVILDGLTEQQALARLIEVLTETTFPVNP